MAVTSSRPTIITRPAATSIRNDTMRCFRKLRCFSTPHASLTALVIAPNTPREDQMSARLPEGIELGCNKVQPCREIAEDEREYGEALIFARGDRAKQRDDEQ